MYIYMRNTLFRLLNIYKYKNVKYSSLFVCSCVRLSRVSIYFPSIKLYRYYTK